MPHENKITQDDWTYPIPYNFDQADAVTEAITDIDDIRTYIEEGNRIVRTVVAGSRSIKDKDLVRDVIMESPQDWYRWIPTELVHGGAEGVDTLADEIAREGDMWDVITTVRPRAKYGPSGPIIRNGEMAKYADNLIAIREHESSGTRDMTVKALDNGLNIHIQQL